MSDENTPQGSGTPPPAAPSPNDELKNLKAEMNRKLENTNTQLAQLLAAIQPKPAAPAEGKKIEELWYDNPAEAARRIKEETQAEIRRELQHSQQSQMKQANTINALVSEFPELADQNSAMYKKSIEIFNSLPEDERSSPVAYKAAVKEAALDLDIKPKSKRKAPSADDSFALGGNDGAPAPRGKKAEDEREMAAKMALAEAMGVKLTDEAKARLKNNHGRKTYTKWE